LTSSLLLYGFVSDWNAVDEVQQADKITKQSEQQDRFSFAKQQSCPNADSYAPLRAWQQLHDALAPVAQPQVDAGSTGCANIETISQTMA